MYEWHDLKKNPNDLPQDDEYVITYIVGTDVIIAKDGESIEDAIRRCTEDVSYTSCGYYLRDDGWYGADGYRLMVYPRAWKYIEPFSEA